MIVTYFLLETEGSTGVTIGLAAACVAGARTGSLGS